MPLYTFIHLYCNRRLPITMKVCWGANGRPAGCHAKMSRFCVTLPWMDGVVVELVDETRGITVSRHAEFIFDVLFARGRHQIPQPEHTPVSRCVTLKCHAGENPGTPQTGHQWSLSTPRTPQNGNLRFPAALKASYLSLLL